MTGVIPASRQAEATVLPMNPAPPAISTFITATYRITAARQDSRVTGQ